MIETTLLQVTDQKLLELCEKYGLQTRLWRQKFLGLLPEVQKRRLYEKKGCSSIFEFAKKLAGVSEEQVRRVLGLEERFIDKPALGELLKTGKVSVHKLARIAGIATSENQEDLAEQVQLLSKSAIETLVRDMKQESVPGHEAKQLQLSDEVQKKLLELQHKGIDVDHIILTALAEREQYIAQEKERLSAEAEMTDSRYINKPTRDLLEAEYGKKCSIPSCHRLSEEIHHGQRFSLARIHDPRYMAPMCRQHHTIAHSIDIKFQKHNYASQSP